MITLSKEEVESLLKYLGEMPFKMALPLVQFLQKKVKDANDDGNANRE